MKKIHCLILQAVFVSLLSACAISGRDAPTSYDLGPLRADRVAMSPGAKPFLLNEVHAPEWLESTAMYYRLAYVNQQEVRSYANSRWSMPPAKLVERRVKARIVAAGGTVLPANNGVPDGTLLRLELEEFSQRFDAADKSVGQIALRVSAFKDGTLQGQKTFVRYVSAENANAADGAKALAVATDELIGEMLIWLSGFSGGNG